MEGTGRQQRLGKWVKRWQSQTFTCKGSEAWWSGQVIRGMWFSTEYRGFGKKKHLVGMMIGITIRLAFDNEGSRVSTHHEEGEFGVKALVKSCKVTWWQENSLMRPSDDICFGTVAILNLRQMPSRCTLGTSCACFQKIPCTSAPNAQMTKNNFRIRCNRITCRFE